MEKHLNTFLAGVDRDTAHQAMQPGFLRDLENFRLENIHGQGFVLTQVKGNEFKFQLSDGYIPLGSVSYGGVAFILSYNPEDGIGEIGTFPSPNTDGNGGFQHVYRALQNWTGVLDPSTDPPRLPFATTLFNVDCAHQAEMEACISYDGSVNLYIADWKNPLRVVNSGFNIETGVYNTRLYWTGGFGNQTDVFFESCPHPIFSTVTVQDGGAWKSGNTIFFIRYKNASFDSSSFLAESMPVEIFADGVDGGVTVDGSVEDLVCNKSIVLDLTNIDPQFAFVEIGFLRYTGASFITGLIDALYTVPAGGGAMQIIVTGFETVIDLTADDLIARKALEDCPRTITQHERRLMGGNWRSSIGDTDELLALSQAIIIKPCDPDDQHEFTDNDFRLNLAEEFQYKFYNHLTNYVGYFRGETYSFAIIWVLKGGKESQPYPLTGYDAWLDPGITTTNNRGILRMPSNMNTNYAYLRDRGTGQGIQVLGVKLDVSAVVITPWITDNVCGFYLTRAERKPQLLAQAHVANCWFPDGTSGPWHSTPPPGIGPVITEGYTANWIPEFNQGFGPGSAWPVPVHIPAINLDGAVLGQPARKEFKFGAFSTSHFFSRGFTDGDYTAIVQGRAVLNVTRMSTATGFDRDPDYLWEQRDFTPGTDVLTSSNYGVLGIVNVRENTYSATGGGFVSKFSEYVPGSGLPFFYFGQDALANQFWSREMRQRAYLGLSTDITGSGLIVEGELKATHDDVALINIYRSDPVTLDISVLYDPRHEFYAKISNFIPLSDLAGIGTSVFYRGDCFIARTYHQHMRSFDERAFADSNGGVFYRHGCMAGLTQELPINSGMRRSGNSQTYYPEQAPADPMSMAADFGGADECALYNNGYHKVLSIYQRVGFDVNLPAGNKTFPVRIKYSREQLPNSFADGYRQWSLAGMVDYDNKFGQIVRIGVQDNSLFSVQEYGINHHYVNDRVLVGDGSGGSLVLGEGDVLSTKFLNVSSEYGSLHQWSIVKGGNGTYGYDQNSRSVWRLSGGRVDPVSDAKGFRSDVYMISELVSQDTDIMHRFPDLPVCTGGVVGWYDKRHKDVGMTFILPAETCPIVLNTLVFNERRDVYMGKRSHHSPFYFRINNDMYSMNPVWAPWNDPEEVKGQFWLHDSDVVARTSFYNTDPRSLATWTVNPNPSKSKVFDAMHVYSTPQPMASITVRTKSQFSSMSPAMSADAWKTPLYKEGRWVLPFLRADAVVGGQDLGVDSLIRGEWMEVAMRWTQPGDVELASAETHFRTSYT